MTFQEQLNYYIEKTGVSQKELAKEAGLDAIETRYSMFDEKTTEKAIELAQRFGLKQSGGSDFHGKAKPDIDLGNGRGTLSVPFSFYESLRLEQKE